jgi:hypothetical protein
VYFCTSKPYEDIYEFVFECRASKLTENYYYLGVPKNQEELESKARKLGDPDLYNIVSGDKLPDRYDRFIARYLKLLLHYFVMYVKANLGKTMVILDDQTGQPRVVSADNHVFMSNEGWVVNVSNIPIGMLIDYYRIESDITGMNAQLLFIKSSEYRYLVYKYLKAMFVALVRHNPREADDIEISEQSKDTLLIEKVANLIRTYEP